MSGCAGQPAQSTIIRTDGRAEFAVAASDTACALSGTEASTGASAFVITNNASTSMGFSVYDEHEQVMGR